MTGRTRAGLRITTAVALVVDAVVHLQLAGTYDQAAAGGIGTGNLFRIEAVVALLAAVFVLVRGTRVAFLIALGVAGSALLAVVVTRYVDLPAFGPFPAMYEPVWFGKKTLSAVAEGVGSLIAVAGLVMTTRVSEPVRPGR